MFTALSSSPPSPPPPPPSLPPSLAPSLPPLPVPTHLAVSPSNTVVSGSPKRRQMFTALSSSPPSPPPPPPSLPPSLAPSLPPLPVPTHLAVSPSNTVVRGSPKRRQMFTALSSNPPFTIRATVSTADRVGPAEKNKIPTVYKA